jgi:hypothetical protein
MEQFRSKSDDVQSMVVRYCDRCARCATTLLLDDLSLQRLCQDCSDHLVRLRGARRTLY